MNALNRCDRCPAAAKVYVTLLTGELFFCGHHAKEHSLKIKEVAITIKDPESLLHPVLANV